MRLAIEVFSYVCFSVAILLAFSPYILLLWAACKEEHGIRRALRVNRKGKAHVKRS